MPATETPDDKSADAGASTNVGTVTAHNRAVTGPAVYDDTEVVGEICILARNGILYGPFPSRQAAMYWCVAQDIGAFSTYDMVRP